MLFGSRLPFTSLCKTGTDPLVVIIISSFRAITDLQTMYAFDRLQFRVYPQLNSYCIALIT